MILRLALILILHGAAAIAEAHGQDNTLITFDDVGAAEAPNGQSVPLTNQYRQSHGVSFGKGASLQYCSGAYVEDRRSFCPYPGAASGQWAALHDIAEGGSFMQIRIDRPVKSVSMRINPTGGRLGARYDAKIIAVNAESMRVATAMQSVTYGPDAFAWPATLSVDADEPMVQVNVVLEIDGRSVSAAVLQSQPVRFLIDDLNFQYADGISAQSPIAAGIFDQRRPAPVGEAVIVQSPDIGEAQSGLQIYPAATRKRIAIDWDAAFADLAEQESQGLGASSLDVKSRDFLSAAALPVLAPIAADPGSLLIFGSEDAVNVSYRREGREYSVYGSRVLTVIKPAEGAPGVRAPVTFSASEDSLTASFSLYGVSYAMTQYCRGGARRDASCHDRNALRKAAENLVVVIGVAGQARP